MKNSFLLSLFLGLSTLAMAQQPALKVDLSHNLDENSGDVFDVDVRLSDFQDLFAIQLFMKWDSSMYRIESVPFFNADIPGMTAQNIILPETDINKPERGKVRIVWTNAVPHSEADQTLIATLRFTAIGAPCDESNFFFEDIGDQESERLLAADASFNDIGIDFEALAIQIPGGAACISSTDNLLADEDIAIYPNPVKEMVNFDFKVDVNPSSIITVYSLQGQKMRTLAVSGRNNSFDISDLAEGTYLYEITNTADILHRGKLIKVQ